MRLAPFGTFLLLALPVQAGTDALSDPQTQTFERLLKYYKGASVETSAALWQDVRQNRRQFEKQSKGPRTSEQVALEQNFLKQIRTERVALLEQQLQLSEPQVDGLSTILAEDFERKLQILNTGQKGDKELADISQGTVRRFGLLLAPEQLAKYEMLLRDARRSRSPLWASAPSSGGDLPGAVEVAKDKDKPPDEKKGEFLVAPIPMINPTLENGLAVAAGYLFNSQKDVPPSISGIGGFRTSNGSWGVGVLQKLHLKRDRYRITGGAGYVNLNYKFFGIGSSSGNAGEFVPINQSGWGLLLEALVRVRGNWYAGPRYILVKTRVGLHPGDSPPAESSSDAEKPALPVIDLNLRTASLGPHIQRDSRDDEMYPRAGSLFNTQIGFHSKAFGGRRTYQSYQFSFSKYLSLSRRQVLAVRGSSCFTQGMAPFYDLCGFQSKDVRGYAAGRYLDRDMLASQAEFRQELPLRLGLVVFAGAGGVAPKLSEFKFDELRPGAGVGLRFRLTKQNHINLSADYAWGIGSRALYLSVGEVF